MLGLSSLIAHRSFQRNENPQIAPNPSVNQNSNSQQLPCQSPESLLHEQCI